MRAEHSSKLAGRPERVHYLQQRPRRYPGARMVRRAISEADAWKPPSEFDLVKELNAHAGRLSALVSLLAAGSTLGWSLGRAVLSLVKGIDPAVVQSNWSSRDDWYKLIQRKRDCCSDCVACFAVALPSLLFSWGLAFFLPFMPAEPGPVEDGLSRVRIAVLVAAMIVAIVVFLLERFWIPRLRYQRLGHSVFTSADPRRGGSGGR